METNVFSLHAVKLDIILRWIWTFGATTLVDPSYPASIQIHCPFPCGIPKTTVLPGWSPVGIQHNPPHPRWLFQLFPHLSALILLPLPSATASSAFNCIFLGMPKFLLPQTHHHHHQWKKNQRKEEYIYIDIYTYIYTDEENKWERLTQQFLLSNFCDCIVEFSSTLSYGPEN